ncbi:MAG TPA: cytosine permease [Caulobacteraceae bacterium]
MAKTALIETRSIDYVPLSERHGKVWHLWPVWFTGDAHLATLATGALSIALGMNLAWTATAIVLGCALGTFFMAFHSTQGPQLGLPQMIQSRPQFGYLGAILVWGVALVTYVGFNAFNQLLAGATLHQLTGAPAGIGIVVFTLIALGLALVGYDWIHAAQRVLAYVMIAALLIFSIGALFSLKVPMGDLSLASFKPVPFLIQFFAAAAYQLSWSIYVSDYSRYLPPNVGVRASFWWTFLGALIGGAWMMLVGAVAAALAPSLDIVAAVRFAGDHIHAGFGVGLLIVSCLGLLTVSGLNFYGASLTLMSIANSVGVGPSRNGRVVSLVLVAVSATSLAFLSPPNLMQQYQNLLSVLLYLFTPWTAINLIDFYVVRKGRYSVREIFNPHGLYGRWNGRGLSAYAIGFVAMIPFFSTEAYTGPIAKALGGADISMLIGLPVSALAYLGMCRSFDSVRDARLAHEADVGLEAEA